MSRRGREVEMDATIAALAGQHAELAALLRGADEAALQRPSRCDGWTVSDVVLHLAQSDELAIASVAGDYDAALAELTADLGEVTTVDEVIDAMVVGQRGASGTAVVERWERATAGLVDALESGDLRARVMWVGGEVSVRTLATTRLSETWIHTFDVAGALGGEVVPTDRLQPIARLAWRTLPYAFAVAERDLAGPVAFELQGPDGEQWSLSPDDAPTTTITGDAFELCLVAARRLDPAAATSLGGEGPDVDAVLELVRTYA